MPHPVYPDNETGVSQQGGRFCSSSMIKTTHHNESFFGVRRLCRRFCHRTRPHQSARFSDQCPSHCPSYAVILLALRYEGRSAATTCPDGGRKALSSIDNQPRISHPEKSITKHNTNRLSLRTPTKPPNLLRSARSVVRVNRMGHPVLFLCD